MKRIFFFDIDNTLLDHTTHRIPPSAVAAVRQLREAGHTLVIATGRSYEHARPYIDLIGPSYAITQNGARIHHGEEEVFSAPLDRPALDDLFAWMAAQGYAYGANHGGVGYVSAVVPETLAPLGSVGMQADNHSLRHLHEDIYQGWLFFDASLDDTLGRAILARYPHFDMVRWHQTAVDIMPKAISKWSGCQWVMAATGHHAGQAIAFGDGLNDREMLQGVGLGVAMGDGHPELQAIAGHIAPPPHQDGIATALRELALI